MRNRRTRRCTGSPAECAGLYPKRRGQRIAVKREDVFAKCHPLRMPAMMAQPRAGGGESGGKISPRMKCKLRRIRLRCDAVFEKRFETFACMLKTPQSPPPPPPCSAIAASRQAAEPESAALQTPAPSSAGRETKVSGHRVRAHPYRLIEYGFRPRQCGGAGTVARKRPARMAARPARRRSRHRIRQATSSRPARLRGKVQP